MAAFADLNWERIDTLAIVEFGGLAVIDERRHRACHNWLRRERYQIQTLDCRRGLAGTIYAIGELFKWEQQFGYSLEPDRCNLDALNDGFSIDLASDGGAVLEFIRPDIAWSEDRDWFSGLLSIALRESRRHLALGHRFFSLLVVPESSAIVGAPIEQTKVPTAFWSASKVVHEFQT